MNQLITTFFTDFIAGNLSPISALFFILSALYAAYLVTAKWVRYPWKKIYGCCALFILFSVFLNKWSETTFSFYAGRTLFLLLSCFAPCFF